jgi:hypothetical protein
LQWSPQQLLASVGGCCGLHRLRFSTRPQSTGALVLASLVLVLVFVVLASLVLVLVFVVLVASVLVLVFVVLASLVLVLVFVVLVASVLVLIFVVFGGVSLVVGVRVGVFYLQGIHHELGNNAGAALCRYLHTY